jgi:hypothetical protein
MRVAGSRPGNNSAPWFFICELPVRISRTPSFFRSAGFAGPHNSAIEIVGLTQKKKFGAGGFEGHLQRLIAPEGASGTAQMNVCAGDRRRMRAVIRAARNDVSRSGIAVTRGSDEGHVVSTPPWERLKLINSREQRRQTFHPPGGARTKSGPAANYYVCIF